MDASTTANRSRSEQCRLNAQRKSEEKRRAAFGAVLALQREQRPITKAAIARQAGVSVVFLRRHPDLLLAIDEAAQVPPLLPPTASFGDKAKDQMIAALRRRLEEMKRALATKEAELRQKQREIDRLYGKLASGETLTEVELRQKLEEIQTRAPAQGFL